ncbi:PTS transporter subunit EIIC [Vagococcus allomyrinae]|uniref:PTS transporter subunit EIIC n=1 Tax=Vagococcus allomyrinae TaxID=2794353 RepID=UPI001FD7C8BB|nr:PTS transporter subunit EIIC [Vagococcus allomyrinae]
MKETRDEAVAAAIVKEIGGKGNIRAVGHCSSRLRVTLHDKQLVNEKAIEEIDGVKGQFFNGDQYQIILGTGFVDRIYNIVAGSDDSSLNTDLKGDLYEGMSLPKKVSRILGDVFIPVIPVLVATGLFSGIINCINAFGVEMNPNVLTIATILMKTAFTFLPVLIAWAGMKQFGGTPVIGIVLGLMLVNPLLPNPNDVAKGVVDAIIFQPFGLTLSVVGYQGSVLPALVVAIIAAKTEKFLKKKVPDVLDLIITPFCTILVAGLLGLIVVGPICQFIELGVLNAAKAVINLPFGLGGLIIGGTQQAIVVTGMHHIFLALETDLLATTGFNPFNSMITGGIIAQATAAFTVGLKMRDKKKGGFFMSASLPAFLGITEPAIFGVNLKFGKPFLFALCGGATAGWVAGLLHAASTGMGVAAIPGFVTYLYSATGIRDYFIIHGVAILVTFCLVYFFFDPNKALEEELVS